MQIQYCTNREQSVSQTYLVECHKCRKRGVLQVLAEENVRVAGSIDEKVLDAANILQGKCVAPDAVAHPKQEGTLSSTLQ